MRTYFIFDVESIGLHGEGFAVAGGVYTILGGGGIETNREFCFSCLPQNAQGAAPNRDWISANVPTLEITHPSPKEVRNAFWQEWLKAKSQGIEMWAECAWPVEARFLHACVDQEIASREWEGPYPLHDIASLMFAAGMDPMATYPRDSGSEPAHHPLADVRHSLKVMALALNKLKKD